MATRSPYAVVRWTHLPTGHAAQADGMWYCRNQGKALQWAHAMARKHLAAKLRRPDQPAVRRSYHLDPGLGGVEPFVVQGGVRLATGRDNVAAFLAGRIPGPSTSHP